ncbi:MAG TPA: threonylcarbamoyl-AMP synthase [Bacilli bacterium]|nr:threonylcarbamoyl-AMP synthase [Bacilli bacterium]
MRYIQTDILHVDKNNRILRETNEIKEAALWIRNGEVVAFPTETVYGLGGNAFSNEAIEKIYQAKGRPSDNPLIVHIACKEQLRDFVCEVPKLAEQLMNAFWPGPLTLVLPGNGKLAAKVTANLSTVAVRMPDHPVALALIEAAGVPVAAPSANLSGKPSPTTAAHVEKDLTGRIRAIVDGGKTGVGVESTVVDCTGESAMILRPGGVTKEALEAVVGKVDTDPALSEENVTPKSPGVKYTHYAPKAPLYLVEGSVEQIQQLIEDKKRDGLKVGVLTTVEQIASYDADLVVACGSRERLETVASELYGSLRRFDEEQLDILFAETFVNEGLGIAIMNRLEKASGGKRLVIA